MKRRIPKPMPRGSPTGPLFSDVVVATDASTLHLLVCARRDCLTAGGCVQPRATTRRTVMFRVAARPARGNWATTRLGDRRRRRSGPSPRAGGSRACGAPCSTVSPTTSGTRPFPARGRKMRTVLQEESVPDFGFWSMTTTELARPGFAGRQIDLRGQRHRVELRLRLAEAGADHVRDVDLVGLASRLGSGPDPAK